jgi:hypothetical protein
MNFEKRVIHLVYEFLCNFLVSTDFSIMPEQVDVCTNRELLPVLNRNEISREAKSVDPYEKRFVHQHCKLMTEL